MMMETDKAGAEETVVRRLIIKDEEELEKLKKDLLEETQTFHKAYKYFKNAFFSQLDNQVSNI